MSDRSVIMLFKSNNSMTRKKKSKGQTTDASYDSKYAKSIIFFIFTGPLLFFGIVVVYGYVNMSCGDILKSRLIS